MAEEKKKAKAPAPAAKEAEAVESSGPGANKKVSNWTMEKVLKFARRFSSEAEWQAGHPSSFKSATAHKWMSECKKHFRANDSKNKNFKRSA